MASILIVDHEESIRYTFSAFLREAGHSVSTANGLAEGLEAIMKTDFDIVLAEILLNDGNGMRLLQVVKQNPVCRVIMMSDFPCRDTRTPMASRCVYGFLQKPVTQGMLLESVDIALRRRLLKG
jgi:two-component system, NtrC family, response regulator HydG